MTPEPNPDWQRKPLIHYILYPNPHFYLPLYGKLEEEEEEEGDRSSISSAVQSK
jgi:hypothetical protein